MGKYVIGVVVVVVLGLVIFTGGKDGDNVNVELVSASELVAVENNYDFGEIDIFGGEVSTTYTLKNMGNEDVIVKSAVTSCMCTEGKIGGRTFGMHDNKLMSIVVPPGGEEVLTATFDPLAHGPEGTGKITRELTLKTNSSKTPELRAKFSADVIKNVTE